MKTYEKIETIYERDMDGTKKLMPGVWRNKTVEFLKDTNWVWTEKVDGTNVRVYWDGNRVTFGGKAESSELHVSLVNYLNETFGGDENEQLFEQMFGSREVILFGEGYGNKIQGNGKKYIPDGVGFIMFDLYICGNYQTRESVERCAAAFGVKTVPIVGEGTLAEAEAFIKTDPDSVLGDLKMEGVVCRPAMELRDRCGERIIVKIKARDHGGLK